MEEDESLFSSGFFPQMPQDPEDNKARRPRKKAKDAIRDGKKRRLSDEQVRFLEMNFGKERKLESCRKLYLATEIGLDPKQVAVWFQNRRARWKSKQIEEEYSHLRSSHDAILIEKCRLEKEILNLKDKLEQSEEEIRRLTSAIASASSVTMATQLGEFGVEEDDEMYAAASYADGYYYMMEMGYL